MFQGYFDSLRNERLNQSGSGQLAITMLCPGPVFSNVLSESFTETPQQVSIILIIISSQNISLCLHKFTN